MQCEGNVTRDARSSGCTVSTQMTDLRQPTLKAQCAMGQMVEGRGCGEGVEAPGGPRTDLWLSFAERGMERPGTTDPEDLPLAY